MRHIATAAVAALALTAAALPAGTSAATTSLKCGTVATPTGDTGPVTATGTTCRTGRRVAKQFAVKGTSYAGWRCSATPYEGGANVLCKKKTGSAKVKFQVAD